MIVGLILQADEAVLIENRLEQTISIVDEVKQIDGIWGGKLAAIEVAFAGQSIRRLSNPYGIATLLHLNAEETKAVTPIAKSLIGKRSAVVIAGAFLSGFQRFCIRSRNRHKGDRSGDFDESVIKRKLFVL